MNKKSTENSMQIDVPEDVAEGTYSNMAVVAHSSSEFVVDFIRIMPGLSRVKSRIILSPEHAKRLLLALNENVLNYENRYGEIDLETDHGAENFIPPLNNSPVGEA